MQVTFLLILFVHSVSVDFSAGSGCTVDFLRKNLSPTLKSTPITIFTENANVPFASQDCNGLPLGLDIDLMNQISLIYNITFEYQYATFIDFIPTVKSNPNFISISTQTVTKARMKLVNFVQFFQTGSGFLVKSTYGIPIHGLTDLCGKTVSVQLGSIQELDVTAQNTKCGSNKITIILGETYLDIVGLVQNGTADIAVNDQSEFETTVQQSNNALKIVGKPYNVQPYGILCNKKNQKLCCALADAINYLIDQGIYQVLLPKYAFSYKDYGICPSRINLHGTTCTPMCKPSAQQCNK
jgi:polar amino acid transport system substrate-binding protein